MAVSDKALSTSQTASSPSTTDKIFGFLSSTVSGAAKTVASGVASGVTAKIAGSAGSGAANPYVTTTPQQSGFSLPPVAWVGIAVLGIFVAKKKGWF